jgi:hypothetical protein
MVNQKAECLQHLLNAQLSLLAASSYIQQHCLTADPDRILAATHIGEAVDEIKNLGPEVVDARQVPASLLRNGPPGPDDAFTAHLMKQGGAASPLIIGWLLLGSLICAILGIREAAAGVLS